MPVLPELSTRRDGLAEDTLVLQELANALAEPREQTDSNGTLDLLLATLHAEPIADEGGEWSDLLTAGARKFTCGNDPIIQIAVENFLARRIAEGGYVEAYATSEGLGTFAEALVGAGVKHTRLGASFTILSGIKGLTANAQENGLYTPPNALLSYAGQVERMFVTRMSITATKDAARVAALGLGSTVAIIKRSK